MSDDNKTTDTDKIEEAKRIASQTKDKAKQKFEGAKQKFEDAGGIDGIKDKSSDFLGAVKTGFHATDGTSGAKAFISCFSNLWNSGWQGKAVEIASVIIIGGGLVVGNNGNSTSSEASNRPSKISKSSQSSSSKKKRRTTNNQEHANYREAESAGERFALCYPSFCDGYYRSFRVERDRFTGKVMNEPSAEELLRKRNNFYSKLDKWFSSRMTKKGFKKAKEEVESLAFEYSFGYGTIVTRIGYGNIKTPELSNIKGEADTAENVDTRPPNWDSGGSYTPYLINPNKVTFSFFEGTVSLVKDGEKWLVDDFTMRGTKRPKSHQ